MIIGAITLCIGYAVGVRRVRGLYKMAEELADKTSQLLAEVEELTNELEE